MINFRQHRVQNSARFSSVKYERLLPRFHLQQSNVHPSKKQNHNIKRSFKRSGNLNTHESRRALFKLPLHSGIFRGLNPQHGSCDFEENCSKILKRFRGDGGNSFSRNRLGFNTGFLVFAQFAPGFCINLQIGPFRFWDITLHYIIFFFK